MIKIGLELAEKLCRTCPIRKDCRAGALYPEGEKYLCRIAGYKNEIEKIKKEMEDDRL